MLFICFKLFCFSSPHNIFHTIVDIQLSGQHEEIVAETIDVRDGILIHIGSVFSHTQYHPFGSSAYRAAHMSERSGPRSAWKYE